MLKMIKKTTVFAGIIFVAGCVTTGYEPSRDKNDLAADYFACMYLNAAATGAITEESVRAASKPCRQEAMVYSGAEIVASGVSAQWKDHNASTYGVDDLEDVAVKKLTGMN